MAYLPTDAAGDLQGRRRPLPRPPGAAPPPPGQAVPAGQTPTPAGPYSAGTGSTVAADVKPAGGGSVQDDPRFRQLPRNIQLQVENGTTSLDKLAAGGPLDRFGGPDAPGPGGGAMPQPPGRGGGGGSAGGGGDSGILGQLGQGGQDEGMDVSNLIKSQFTDILSGKSGSFSPERFAMMKAALRESTTGQAQASQDQALRNAALTGTFRSPATQRTLRDIDASSRAQFTSGVRDLMIQQAQSQWNDKMQGLQLAQNWLQQRQSYILGKAQIAATLESARIQAGATVAAAGISAAASRYGADRAAGAAGAARREQARQFDAEMSFKKEQAAIDNQFRGMAFAANALGLGAGG